MQNNKFWRHYCRFIDVLSSRVISIAEHILILNTIQVEKNNCLSLLTQYSGFILMSLNVSNHNGMLSTDHFLDLKSIPRVLYSTNQF